MSKGEVARARFEAFHARNPHVYQALADEALDLRQKRPGARTGITLLTNAVRWSWLKTTGDQFRINNDFAPFYARKLMAEYPQLEGVFETRASLADLGHE